MLSFKDGTLIDSKNERIKIVKEKADKGFYEIVIPNVMKEDAGKYSCMAQNRFGETSCEAEVTVTDEVGIKYFKYTSMIIFIFHFIKH